MGLSLLQVGASGLAEAARLANKIKNSVIAYE
jgi:hypothetical protein